jgi:alkylhydroperoxidase domain protein
MSRDPAQFTQAVLGWSPWLPPLAVDEMTPDHLDALVDPARAKNPYFALLVRNPDILRERTKTDNDIFYNRDGGLPRAERELAATAVSRINGCVYCASVHSRFASHYSQRTDDVQRLLDEGIAGDQEPRWRAILDAVEALNQTPPTFGAPHVHKLRDVGLDDLALADLVHAASFFQWANRLMLSLGEPDDPPA